MPSRSTFEGAAPNANLIGSEVAAWMRCSKRTIAQLTRERRIPHVVRGGGRLVLYPCDWILAWGRNPSLPLELVELADGGRIVRPSNAQTDRPYLPVRVGGF